MLIKYPDLVAEAIDKWHEDNQEPPRFHMGCSLLGHHCDRYLWLKFRFVVIEKFNGRILRLFRRGHREEELFIEDLKNIGVYIESRQSHVDFGKFVSGSLDAYNMIGVPGAVKTSHIGEFKTHGDKSFNELLKAREKGLGIAESKPEHYTQACLYMYGKKLDRALYLAVNKNTDELYSERIPADHEVAKTVIERGQQIAMSERMPEPCIGASKNWFKCKMCPMAEFCHETKTTKEVNCRTCANATPKEDSTFYCEVHKSTIPNEFQLKGCNNHILHPDIVPWNLKLNDSGKYATYEINRKIVKNGNREDGDDIFTSFEILANPEGCDSDDSSIKIIRQMGGAIIKSDPVEKENV